MILSSVLAVAYSKETTWLRNTEMVTMYEAMTKISSVSLYLDSKDKIPKDILKNYIHSIDPYGDYFTKKEYKAFQDTLSPDYAGVGMILYQAKRGADIVCIPTGNTLIKKGVSRYDVLVSVDGRSTQAKNIYLVSSWMRGRKNSNITFAVRKSSGKEITISMRRKKQHFFSTQKTISEGMAMIRIIRFTSDTPDELQNILKKWPKNIPIIIDLRGNGGGDFFAAIKSTDLLLAKGRLLASIKTTENTTKYYAVTEDSVKGRDVYVLQDEFTASAAEVFIAALTQNKRARSIGKKSFGKGVAQKFIPLSNGDSLLLTYGKIITPNGKNYHGIGLSPTSSISLKEIFEKK